MKIYSPLVLSHYRNPRNFGKLKKPALAAEELNPLCGDEVKIYLRVLRGKIKEISHEAKGCALTVAAASVLTQRITNQELGIREIEKIGKADLENWLGIKVGPARESCITLALNAIRKALS